ncbi:la-related protein 1C [Setaria italica]|uniref:la-related protein 1C n=1 Tax=Setaria italica TaxID=4555 RepID=UPI00064599A0|nr:la-related protein 1C [Setaria italica]
MASGAGDGASLAKAGVNDATSPVKKNEPVPFAWKDLPPADVCMPVLGVADELWPELSRSTAAAKGKGKGKSPSSSSTALDAPITAAPLLEQGSISSQSPGASTRRHGDRAGSAAAVVPSPMHGPNYSRERRADAPEQPPSHRSINNERARGHHQQNGRFVPHPHGRGGGEGYNRGGGSRRPPVGSGANGRGDINVNGNAYRNRGGGGWQRHEHRGGFNGQPRGRGYVDDHRGPGHRPLGPPMGYIDAPHHMHPAPPFMGMVPPPMPYPYYYGMPYGYPGYFAPPLQGSLPPCMQYGQIHVMQPQTHAMQPNLAQQAGPSQTEPQQQQPVQGQQTPPNQENQQTPEQLRQVIRKQIEYYFSTENLDEDIYLRAQMDEQGWVPLTLIAGFKKVCSTTTDMELILDSILPSTEVDILISDQLECF